MAVQVWIGEKPEHANERRAIMALAKGLERLDGLYLILANFSVGGRNVDLVIIKNEAIFIIELKHCDGRVLGSVNGHWFVEGRNGERKRINPGRKNPYNQVISYFHALTNFLNEHRRTFLSEHKSNSIDFRTCKRVVVIAPSIAPDSEIEVDWKVELKGLDELPAYLVTERSSEIDLTDEEVLAIPELLHCTPWQEINALIAGVLPAAEAAIDPENPPPPPPARSAELTAKTEPEPGPASAEAAPQRTFGQRLSKALRTTVGRFAIAMSLLAVVLLIALLTRPPQIIVPQADQPNLSGVTSEPAEPFFSAGLDSNANCIWSGQQLVGKRWDTTNQSWTSVTVDGTNDSDQPEVVVTLEQVAYCDSTITFTWSMRNNSERAVEFPLRNDNIRISDALGNEYAITDDASRPAVLRVAPGNEGRGTAVVSHSLSQNATSLLVRLKSLPFGEASFVVTLTP
jgi:hypothetical protein